MRSHTLRFPRRPKAKERPRLGRRRKVYTPEATLEWEQALAEAWDGPLFEGPVQLVVGFYKDEVVINVLELERERSKLRGDVDNYLKIVLDGLNGVAYLDDKQVVLTTAEKIY